MLRFSRYSQKLFWRCTCNLFQWAPLRSGNRLYNFSSFCCCSYVHWISGMSSEKRSSHLLQRAEQITCFFQLMFSFINTVWFRIHWQIILFDTSLPAILAQGTCTIPMPKHAVILIYKTKLLTIRLRSGHFDWSIGLNNDWKSECASDLNLLSKTELNVPTIWTHVIEVVNTVSQ